MNIPKWCSLGIHASTYCRIINTCKNKCLFIFILSISFPPCAFQTSKLIQLFETKISSSINNRFDPFGNFQLHLAAHCLLPFNCQTSWWYLLILYGATVVYASSPCGCSLFVDVFFLVFICILFCSFFLNGSFSSAKSKLIGAQPIAVSITSKPMKVRNDFFGIKRIAASFATKNDSKMEQL